MIVLNQGFNPAIVFEKAVKDMIKENEKCKRDEKHKSSKHKYNYKEAI
jgi:hypothetical protein